MSIHKNFNIGHQCIYLKVAISNKSRLAALAGFFGLLMKGIFDSYVLLWPFDKKLIS